MVELQQWGFFRQFHCSPVSEEKPIHFISQYRVEQKCIRFLESFVVKNLVHGSDLHFAITAVARCPSDNVAVKIDPEEAVIRPQDKCQVRLMVTLWDPNDDALAKGIMLVIQDLVHPNSWQTISMSVSSMEVLCARVWGAPCVVPALCEKQATLDPFSPMDHSSYCVPIHWTTQILTQSTNPYNESKQTIFPPKNARLLSKSAVFAFWT